MEKNFEKTEKIENTFEENLEELEQLVKKLENGDVPLDHAIEDFNKAMKLAKLCDEKLKQAETTLSKIVKEDGTIEEFKEEETN